MQLILQKANATRKVQKESQTIALLKHVATSIQKQAIHSDHFMYP